jgi:hypothetical protein
MCRYPYENTYRKICKKAKLIAGNGAVVMNNRTLAIIGVGLYILGVLTSVTDAKDNPEAPAALIMFWGVAKIIFVILAGYALWKVGEKWLAIALPVLSLLELATADLTTAQNSAINLGVNTIKMLALVIYFYALYRLFTSNRERQPSNLGG